MSEIQSASQDLSVSQAAQAAITAWHEKSPINPAPMDRDEALELIARAIVKEARAGEKWKRFTATPT